MIYTEDDIKQDLLKTNVKELQQNFISNFRLSA